ncbi:hypothetical protein [Streptomyces phaeochromogenes]|uniref:hypothetical protein n=1 Tax=Streptomyces phaeochromogenes TaxID=1923 RepID=UPI002DD9A202|nr:hypothetical protein [Streptomyces phaeochromogenes]WRZ28858.1 hypothetical protein OG931_14385 [Streptomyces phaeochromogenes]
MGNAKEAAGPLLESSGPSGSGRTSLFSHLIKGGCSYPSDLAFPQVRTGRSNDSPRAVSDLESAIHARADVGELKVTGGDKGASAACL